MIPSIHAITGNNMVLFPIHTRTFCYTVMYTFIAFLLIYDPRIPLRMSREFQEACPG